MRKSKILIFMLALIMLFSTAVLTACGNNGGVSVTFRLNLPNFPDAPEAPAPITVKYGEKYGELPDVPQRSGYTFAGWYTTPTSMEGKLITSETEVVQKYDHILYARWTGNNVTVKFDIGDGFIEFLPFGINEDENGELWKTVTVDKKYGVMPEVRSSADGDVFMGWYTAQTGGQLVDTETIMTLAEDHTLYARFHSSHWDFSTPGDKDSFINFFPLYSSLNFEVDDSRGDGKNWLEITGSPNVPNYIFQFALNVPIQTGQVFRFDIDFDYPKPLKLAKHENVNALTDTIRVAADIEANYTSGQWTTDGRIGQTWPEEGMTVSHTASVDGRPVITVWMSSSLDFNAFSCFITNVSIITRDENKAEWDFSDSEDLGYFSQGPLATGTVNFDVADIGGKKWMAVTMPESELNQNDVYTLQFVFDKTLSVGNAVDFDLKISYTGDGSPLVAPSNGSDAVVAGVENSIHAEVSGDKFWGDSAWYSYKALTANSPWPSGGTHIKFAPHQNGRMMLTVRINKSIDLSKLTLYVADVGVSSVELPDSGKTFWDFSNSNDTQYFQGQVVDVYGQPSFKRIDRSADGLGDWRLQVTSPDAILQTSGNNADMYVLTFFLDHVSVASGASVSFDLDFEYPNSLTLAGSNASVATKTNSIQAEVSLKNNWTGAWNTNTAFAADAAWPKDGTTVTYNPAADGTLLITVRINKNIDMTKFALYIDNLVVA